jgi:restriction endonuclease S subunit
MVEAQTKNQNVFWLWNKDIDFQKRGDTQYWLPMFLENETEVSKFSKLTDLVELRGGATPLGSNYVEHGIPFLRIQNIGENELILDEVAFISEDTHEGLLRRSQLKSGDVLFTITGRIGSVAVVPDEMKAGNINQHMVRMRIKNRDKLLPHYLSTYLLTDYAKLQHERVVYGTTRIALDYPTLYNLKVFVPPLKDQQKVEQIVKEAFQLKKEAETDYQKSQQLLNEVLGLAGVEKKLERAFWRWSDEIDIVGRIDPNYYQKYFQELKASRKKLKTVKLETLALLIDYGTVPTSPDAPPKFGTPYLTGKNIQPNDLVLDKLDYLYTDTTEAIKNKAIKAGDVVITQMGTVGNAAVMGEKQEGWFFGSFLIRIRPNKGISPEWLALVINSDFGKQQIQQAMTTATVRTNTDLPTIKGLEISVINKKKEKEIVNLYIQSRSKKALSQQKLQEAGDFVENLIKKSL